MLTCHSALARVSTRAIFFAVLSTCPVQPMCASLTVLSSPAQPVTLTARHRSPVPRWERSRQLRQERQERKEREWREFQRREQERKERLEREEKEKREREERRQLVERLLAEHEQKLRKPLVFATPPRAGQTCAGRCVRDSVFNMCLIDQGFFRSKV